MFGEDGRVRAVLDWELCTLGLPLADLAYSAMAYHLPAGTAALPALPQPLPPGAPPLLGFLLLCEQRIEVRMESFGHMWLQ